MTYIPDTRSDDSYNQKYLNERGKAFVQGFDCAIQDTLGKFFDGIGDMEDEYLDHVLSQKVPDFMRDTFLTYDEFGNEVEHEIDTYADYLYSKIIEISECDRDELIVSIIDGMDDEEYEKIKTEVDAQEE